MELVDSSLKLMSKYKIFESSINLASSWIQKFRQLVSSDLQKVHGTRENRFTVVFMLLNFFSFHFAATKVGRSLLLHAIPHGFESFSLGKGKPHSPFWRK